MKNRSLFRPNVFTAFGVLFILSASIMPIQNLIVWGPEMVQSFYISNEVTAEKISIGVFVVGIIFIYTGFRVNPRME